MNIIDDVSNICIISVKKYRQKEREVIIETTIGNGLKICREGSLVSCADFQFNISSNMQGVQAALHWKLIV